MPEVANRSESLQLLTKSNTWNYPTSQINGLKIDIPIQYLDLFINNISGTIQEKAYNLLIKRLKKDNPILNKKNKGVQYTIIDGPLQLLNMVYPNKALIDDKKTTSAGVIDKMYGREGLLRLMKRDDNKEDTSINNLLLIIMVVYFQRKKLKHIVVKYTT